MKRARLVREGKLFCVCDLFVYGAVAVLIAVLFALFVFADLFRAEDARGVRAEVEGETVYTYVFGEGGSVARGWEERVQVRAEGELLFVRIQTEHGYNELVIHDGAQTAAMHDADCSLRKDCTAMRAIGEGGSVIVCIPHAVRVLPLEGEDLSSPSVG